MCKKKNDKMSATLSSQLFCQAVGVIGPYAKVHTLPWLESANRDDEKYF